MSYQNVSDFLLYATPTGAYSTLPTGSIQRYLDVAQSEIDAALRIHHTLPLSIVPAVISDAETVIASWRLLQLRGFEPQSNDGATLRARYDEIMDAETGLLARISRGVFVFAKDVDATPTTREAAPRVYASVTRGFKTYEDQHYLTNNNDLTRDKEYI